MLLPYHSEERRIIKAFFDSIIVEGKAGGSSEKENR